MMLDLMDNVAANENYDVQNNGTFRTFSANSGGSSSAPNFSSTPNFSGSNTHSVSSPAPKAMRFNAKNMVAIKESEADTGDWKVYSTQVQDELFFDKSFTRDQVRCAYRLEFPMAIKFTRAHRIK